MEAVVLVGVCFAWEVAIECDVVFESDSKIVRSEERRVGKEC